MSSATICPFCAVGCGLTVEAISPPSPRSACADAAASSPPLPRFRGNPDHPVNHGALCARGAAATFETASRERLLTPLRRAPGASAWTAVTWENALDRVAAALLETRARTWDAQRGAAAGIGFFGGATAMNEEAYLFARLARVLGVLDLDHQGRSCHSATTAGLRATLGAPAATHDWSDLLASRWVLVIGSNLSDAHPIAARYLHGARARGARVIVVDPRASRTANGADLHLPIRPGTDLALLGLLIGETLARSRADLTWLARNSDAANRVQPEAEIDPDTGRFGGWDEAAGAYNTAAWRSTGGDRLDHPQSVLSVMQRHFSRYTPPQVAAITGLPVEALTAVADLVCAPRRANEGGAIVFSMGVTQQLSGVATVRAAAILQALLGHLDGPGGGLFPMKGHANIQGATDLGGLYTHLPGYLPTPTTAEPDLETYTARYGETPARRLRRLLHVWFDDGEAAYARLPRRRDGVHHSLHAALDRGATELLVLLGQNPMHGSGNPLAVERSLRNVKMLVCIDPFLNDTSTFWERDLSCDTEVLALPSAMFAEKPGSRTNACRLVQWQDAGLPPRGASRPDAWIIDQLWTRVAHAVPGTRWPHASGRVAQQGTDNAVRRDGDAASQAALYRAIHAEIRESCWMYEGMPHTGTPWHWPGGQPRLRDGFTRRVRLWAGPSDVDGEYEEAVPDGPLPEYYAPPGAGDNPLHPAQSTNPLLGVPSSDAFPLLLSTSMTGTDGRRCVPSGATRDGLEVSVPQALAARLERPDGSRIWVETAYRRAAAVLRVVEAPDHGVVWAPSYWSSSADDRGFHAVVDPGDRHTLLDDLRLIPCRLVPRP